MNQAVVHAEQQYSLAEQSYARLEELKQEEKQTEHKISSAQCKFKQEHH